MTRSIAWLQIRPAPGAVWQAPRVEVGVDRHVVAVALGRRQQRIELDFLDRPLGRAPMLAALDGVEHLVVGVARQASRDVGDLAECRQRRGVVTACSVPQSCSTAVRTADPASGSESALITCAK